jgi:RecA/RadA recombinase
MSTQVKPPEAAAETKPKSGQLLSAFRDIVGADVVMVFGETGSSKSKICLQLAREAIAGGGTAQVVDTERNLSVREVDTLGKGVYRYTPVFAEIRKIIQDLPKADVAILDSIGLPVLIQYSRLNMRDRLYAFLEMASILGDLKDWSYKHNALAVVTNQPVSEFEPDEKRRGEPRDPFGGKAKFVAKEIWQTALVSRDQRTTRTVLTAYRSRELAFGTVIAELTVTDAGLETKLRLDRAMSQELSKTLGDEILHAATLEDLGKVGARINSLKTQLSPEQKTWLREAYGIRKKELTVAPGTSDQVIPDEEIGAD